MRREGADRPARMQHHVPDGTAVNEERHGEAVAAIVFAHRRHLRIDRNDQGLKAGILGPAHQGIGLLTLGPHIELEPLPRPLACGGDRFDGAER